MTSKPANTLQSFGTKIDDAGRHPSRIAVTATGANEAKRQPLGKVAGGRCEVNVLHKH
jgi:hypothetical protein